jgi:ferric iron reductase protein FhuF
MWWRPAAGGPLPMAVRDLPTVPCGDLPAARVAEMLPVDGLVRPILEVFRSEFRLSPKVLWGNVASALAGATGMVGPAHEQRARDILAACLDRPPLAGTGSLVPPRRVLARANCCLYYRIPGGGTCGDCVLNRRDSPS